MVCGGMLVREYGTCDVTDVVHIWRMSAIWQQLDCQELDLQIEGV